MLRCEGFDRRGDGFQEATGLTEEARDTDALLTYMELRIKP